MHKDNTDIKTDLNQAFNDINTWKAKFEALERAKNREIEEVKNSFDANKKYQSQLREMRSRYQAERADFEAELRKVKESNETKNREIEELRFNIGQFSRKMQEYSNIAEKYEDVEGKIAMATEEI